MLDCRTNNAKFQIIFENLLTMHEYCDIIFKQSQKDGGIAQLARAIGSYPIGRGFKSNFRYQARWSSGQDTALSRR